MSVKQSIRDQFDQCAQHYLQDSPMGDANLLQLIVQLAQPLSLDRSLDVACGAGMLVAEFAPRTQWAAGIDLSSILLCAAEQVAVKRGVTNVEFRLGDAELIPFDNNYFNIVTSKLALHYFHKPDTALGEMKRVAKAGGRILLIDRIASADPGQQEYHNLVEKLRTPTKVKVYAQAEIAKMITAQGLRLTQVVQYEQVEAVDDWLATTGSSAENQRLARELLVGSLEHDLAGIPLSYVENRLMMSHRTAIFVAVKQ
jgi:ubiquinone/menaquinone biosynthesis C-methylase UbiE